MTRNTSIVPAEAGVFSEIEEAFFRAGDDGSFADAATYDSFDDLDLDAPPSSVWDRLTDGASHTPQLVSPLMTREPANDRASDRPENEPAFAFGSIVERSMLHPIEPALDEDEPEDDDWDWEIAIARARLADAV